MVFGDSLSWGYIPGTSHERYDAQTRWPGQLQTLLGDGYEVIEESLNSRGIEHGDPRPGKEGRRALDYIEACLDSHDPLDYVIVLLGTNELKYELDLSAEDVGVGMEKLLNIIKTRPSQFRSTTPDIILVAPPIINEEAEAAQSGGKYRGATLKAQDLQDVYKRLAEKLKMRFIALDTVIPGKDGIHIDAEQHAKVARLVHDVLASE